MSDFDTRRIGEVAALQEQVELLTKQVAGYRMIAERWQPKFGTAIDGTNVKISLSFGGKVATASIPTEALARVDATSATTTVLQSLIDQIVLDQLRPLAQPEVQKLIEQAAVLLKAGKW